MKKLPFFHPIRGQREIFLPAGTPGTFAVPGLHDAHLHITGMGMAVDFVDLMGCRSVGEVRQRIAAFLAERPGLKAIRGRSWNHTHFEGRRLPTATDLDGLTDLPIYLTRQDGHACWVNRVLLDASPIGPDTADPDGGRIVRDGAGRATGVLLDTAMPLVARLLPTPSADEMRRWVRAGVERCVSAGLTAVHDVDVPVSSFEELERLDAARTLPLRVFVYLRDEPKAWKLLGERGFQWTGAGGRLTLMGVKFFADGALGSHGASMLCPYCNDPGRGLVLLDDDGLRERIGRCHELGVQSATHAIGDAANRAVLRAIAAVQGDDRRIRHRVEHAQILNPEDFLLMVSTGAIASMQPIHGTSDASWAEDWIGLERLRGAYAWRELKQAGVPLAFGSDAPVEPVCPLEGLQAAWRGETRDGREPPAWLQQHCMEFADSLAGFTTGAAYALQAEGRFDGDYTLLSGDPREAERGWLDLMVVGRILGAKG